MKKKILKIVIVMLLLVLVYATIVDALSFSVTMNATGGNTVQESTEFIVRVKITNIDLNNENGINQLSGCLNYDTSIFEPITATSIEGMNTWKVTYDPDDNGKISLTKVNFVEFEEEVFQITFKTKAGTTGKSGNIQFTKIVASNSVSETSASDTSITIQVGDPNSGNTNANANTNSNANRSGGATIQPRSNNSANTNTNTNINTNTNNNTNTNTNTNSNASNRIPSYVNQPDNSHTEGIPYTGVEDTVMYIIGAIIIAAIVFYIKFEKINKDDN